MDTSFRIFPEQASRGAAQVDYLYFFLLSVATFFTLLIFCMILYFVIKYRRGARVDRTPFPNSRSWLLEITWTLIPLTLTMIMFGWGAKLFFQNNQLPIEGLEINVVAKQWMWKIQHANGKQEVNALHVPVGRPVKLRMVSEDVIHSFYVPSFRVKQDVLPGRYTTMWFEPTKPGTYHLFCAEYCGTNHSRMIGEVIVQEPAQYAEWLQGGPTLSPEAAGEKLFEQFRCGTCHDNPANPRCPSLIGIFGRTVSLQGGATVVADEAYLRESILDPAAKIVAGYKPTMPTYKGQIGEEGVFQLIAYLKTLHRPLSPAETSTKETPMHPSDSPRTNDSDKQP